MSGKRNWGKERMDGHEPPSVVDVLSSRPPAKKKYPCKRNKGEHVWYQYSVRTGSYSTFFLRWRKNKQIEERYPMFYIEKEDKYMSGYVYERREYQGSELKVDIRCSACGKHAHSYNAEDYIKLLEL